MNSRFQDEAADVFLAPCPSCVHKDPGAATCAAFPAGIPAVILRGDNQHREPFPGDHGIRFDPISSV